MLSHKDRMLLGNDDGLGDSPDIQPNSQYDQSIAFDDDSEPGAYSPRPDPSDPMPDFQQFQSIGKQSGIGSNPLAGFELNFQDNQLGGSADNFRPSTNNQRRNAFGGFSGMNTGFDLGGTGGSGFNDFSPRPAAEPPAPEELAGLFSLISKYQPPALEIAPHFKPFLPDLIPSIGAIDAFIKVPRPDGEQDPLGLTILDEPTIGCTNPQILKMQLRERFGVLGGNEGDGYIGSIREPYQNPKALASFLESYDEISRNRAAPNMTYSFKVPDIEELMQPWPDEMETALSSCPLPAADIDLTLEEYARVICALLDIPVKGNIVESVHLLFTLYQQFKECNYFTNAGASRGSTPNPN